MLKQWTLTFLILLPYFFVVSGLAFIKDGDKKMVILAIISILVSLFIYKLEPIKHNIKNKLLWVVFALALYTGIMHHLQGGSPGLIRAYVCIAILMLCFPTQLISQRLLIILSILGSMALFINSAYHAFYLGQTRWFGTLNPIPYATMAASLALLSLYHLLEVSSRRVKFIGSIALILSGACVVLSLTRGIWLALLISLLTMIFINALRKKVLVKYLVVSAVVFFGFIVTFQSSIEPRLKQTEYEISQINAGNMNTSIGLRLQMWQASLYIWKENPYLGVGSGHTSKLEQLYKSGTIEKGLIKFNNQHYHNQVIDYAVKLGVIGVLFLILLYLVPIYSAIKYHSPYLSFIVGLVVLYFVSGLTDVPLNHAETTLMYLMLIIPLCSKQLSLSNNQEGAV